MQIGSVLWEEYLHIHTYIHTYIHTHGIGLSIRVMLNTKPALQVFIIQVHPYSLQTIKGGKDGRPAVEQLVAILRRSLTSDDSRTFVQRTKAVQSTTQRLQRLLSFRTSPQEGLHNRTTSPTLSCSCFVADSHDHLEFLQT